MEIKASITSASCIAMKITDGPKPVGRQGSQTNLPGGKFNIGIQMEMTVSIQIFGNTKIINRPLAMHFSAPELIPFKTRDP